MSLTSVFAPSKERPHHHQYVSSSSLLLKDGLTLTALLALGGLIQTILLYSLPPLYALVPVLAVTLYSILDAFVCLLSSRLNRHTQRVVFGRTSAQLPDPATGNFSSEPASSGMVVLHVGARCNHTLGALAPGFLDFSNYLRAMNEELKARATEFGLYSITSWLGNETATNNSYLNIYYFRDMDGLNRFAQGIVHRKGWAWYNKKAPKHIGVFHEVFEVPAKSWETIYLNMQPTLLGDGHVPCRNEDKGEVWISPLVHAKTLAMRSLFSRMGRTTPSAVNEPVEGEEPKVEMTTDQKQ